MARNRYFEDEVLANKINGKMIKKALYYALPHRKVLITMGVLMLVMSFVSLLPPLLNGLIIDYAISHTGYGGLGYWDVAFYAILAWVTIGVAEVVFNFFRMLYMSKAGHNIVMKMRDDTFCNLQRLAFDYYDSRPAGKILVRVTSYLDELSGVFSNALLAIIVDALRVFIILVWLFVLNYKLALVVAISVIPMGFCLLKMQTAITKRHRIVRNKVSNRTAFIAENIQGTFVTKAFNRAKINTNIYAEIGTEIKDTWMRVIHIGAGFYSVMDGFFYLGVIMVYAVVIFFGTQLPNFGGLTLGTTISFIMYMGMFSAPLNNIAAILQQLASASSNLERVFEVIDTPPSITDSPDAVVLPEVEGNIKFDNVTFCYDKGRPILENFNLEVDKGRMVALVGPTGAGKSTVVNLLSRFYDLESGAIYIDGYDIAKVNLHSLRTQVGVMMQDTFIFSGTILENIRYARPEATDAQCMDAARQVNAHDFIMGLENGYDTKVLEQGAGLSSGQKQLLSFARVVLSDPKILILDEATSSIDTQTEEIIRKALDIILKGRTSFVIAHRLSTIRKADCILYIANKGIAEAGTHDELMEKKALYYNLVMGH